MARARACWGKGGSAVLAPGLGVGVLHAPRYTENSVRRSQNASRVPPHTSAERRESRRTAWARVCRREAHTRNPYAIYSTWRWPAAPKQRESRRMARARPVRGKGGACGVGAGLEVGGLLTDTPLISHSSLHCERCAADSERFASPAAHFAFSI